MVQQVYATSSYCDQGRTRVALAEPLASRGVVEICEPDDKVVRE